MSDAESEIPSIVLRVVYVDLPDMIEIETRVRAGDWCGTGYAYTSPNTLSQQAQSLAVWSRRPNGEAKIEAGADTGIGWLLLRFFTVDKAGHCNCHITLATNPARQGTPDDMRRLSLGLTTELGLIEHFALQLNSIATTCEGEAILCGASGEPRI